MGITALIFIIIPSLQILDLIFPSLTSLYSVGSYLNCSYKAQENLFSQIQSSQNASKLALSHIDDSSIVARDGECSAQTISVYMAN